MASPITSWEGAEAYFTYADSGTALGVWLVVAIALFVGVIAATYIHENRSFATLSDDE